MKTDIQKAKEDVLWAGILWCVLFGFGMGALLAAMKFMDIAAKAAQHH